MYFIMAESRLKTEIAKVLNDHFGDRAKAHIDQDGHLTLHVLEGFNRVEDHLEPRKHDGVLICGGGVEESLNGMKFGIVVKKEGN